MTDQDIYFACRMVSTLLRTEKESWHGCALLKPEKRGRKTIPAGTLCDSCLVDVEAGVREFNRAMLEHRERQKKLLAAAPHAIEALEGMLVAFDAFGGTNCDEARVKARTALRMAGERD